MNSDVRDIPRQTAFDQNALLKHADSLGINWQTLPKPMMFSSLLGYTPEWYRAEVVAGILKPSIAIQRPLTQPETDAISQSLAKSLRTRSFELPLTISTALFMERRGRAEMKFPFISLPKNFNLEQFSLKYAPRLTAGQAKFAMSAVRYSCYAFVSHMVFSVFMWSYASSVSAVEMMGDKRLESFVQELRTATKATRGPRPPLGQGLPIPQRSDDASPSNDEQEAWPSQDKTDSTVEEAARRQQILMQASRQPYEQQPARPEAIRQTYGQQPAQSEATQSDIDEGSMFDDASPVSPAEQRQQQRRPLRGGSAWDRIREEAKNDTSPGQGTGPSSPSSRPSGFWSSKPGMPPQRRGDQGSDEYSYSQADEEKSYAKQQAQKEFDEMVERERRGEESGRRR